MEHFNDWLHWGLFGQPGSSKSTIGLSFPGVEQHVFGSSEHYTAKNFVERKDILSPLVWDWMDFLKEEEKEKLFSEDESKSDIEKEREAGELKKLATARKIAKYRRYILKTKQDLKTGKRPDLKTLFLDNGTPFVNEFADYIDVVFHNEFVTSGGNYDSIKFSIKFSKEFGDFIRLFNSLECNTVISFHVQMTVDEETAANVDFMNDAKKGVKHNKEFNPMVPGKVKYSLPGMFDHAFFLFTEESPGQPNKYIAKLEADSSNIGIAKARLNPFDNPRRIVLEKNGFYDQFMREYNKKFSTGK